MIAELRAKFTMEEIAKEMGCEVRDAYRYARGRQPCGVRAILLYKFHAKHCPSGQSPSDHLAAFAA